MRARGFILAVLLGTSACGELAAFGPEFLDAQDRPAIGGEFYDRFRISPDLPRADRPRAAVMLNYLMTDEVLDKNAVSQSDQSLRMLMAMDDWTQTNTHQIVFRDGDQNGDSRLYYLQNADTSPTTIRAPQSPLARGVGEVQSNNPQVFAQVLGWTLDHYPGQRKYLHIYTHGGGVRGIGTDDTQTQPNGTPINEDDTLGVMRLHRWGEAIRQGLKGRQLDMVYFQSCLMGNLEALYELRGSVRYAVASEAVSYRTANAGLIMPALFHDLAEKQAEPAQIAQMLSMQGHAKHETLPDGSFSGFETLAAFDLSRVDEVKTAVNRLALALLSQLKRDPQPVLAAYDGTHAFDRDEVQLDLWHFASEVSRHTPDPAIQAAVAELRQAQRRFMLHERDSHPIQANGLSIFLPARTVSSDAFEQRFLRNSYARTRFAQETAWDDFLSQVFRLRGRG